jgi:hypothetical protein
MKDTFDIILLLGLPASGKSEIRRFFAEIDPEKLRKDFHIGDTINMDDFPYVFFMRSIDEELKKMGEAGIFAEAYEKPFADPRDWGTLIHLLNEDYFDLVNKKIVKTDSSVKFLMDRIDRAGKKVGIDERLKSLKPAIIEKLSGTLEHEAVKILNEKYNSYPADLNGKTVIIEFARGGEQGSKMPLNPPFGYQYSLQQLDDEILERSVILYNWVTPEESRKKNLERMDPNDPGSILHHGVPLEVMLKEYGVDDIKWLENHSDLSGTVSIKKHSRTFYIPIATFDNRSDKTTFLRADVKMWDEKKLAEITKMMKEVMDKLY